MLLRIILFAVLVYVFTKIFKKLFYSPMPRTERRTAANRWFESAGPRHVDEMVQDPVCRVYIPKREALTAQITGTTYYFCSKECLEKFKSGTP